MLPSGSRPQTLFADPTEICQRFPFIGLKVPSLSNLEIEKTGSPKGTDGRSSPARDLTINRTVPSEAAATWYAPENSPPGSDCAISCQGFEPDDGFAGGGVPVYFQTWPALLIPHTLAKDPAEIDPWLRSRAKFPAICCQGFLLVGSGPM